MRKRQWIKEEDELLAEFVKYNGTRQWINCVEYLKKNLWIRKRSECRDRWFNQLNPKIDKNPWRSDQLKILFQSVEKYGSRWSKIWKKIFPNKTQNSIKNQFYSIVRSSLKILTKIYRPTTLKLTNRLTPNQLFQIFVNQHNKQSNILKQMIFNLNFQIYKQNVARFIIGNETQLDQFYNQIQDTYNDFNLKLESMVESSKSQEINDNQKSTQTNSSKLKIKYMMINTLIPIYITEEKQIKLVNEQDLIEQLNKQLKNLDAESLYNQC